MTCIKCKQPMVGGEYELMAMDGMAGPRWTVGRRMCPDCRENMGRPKEVDLNCFEYIRPSRVGIRLRDGFALMNEA